ncbi:phage terminase small subunit P27 family [uncultured Parasutterella sp.]|uniref:phage terminase small subunit P27 family n=1 Tax=uncultured Parasutterella sp. TaxID=1263098 RepID=UPI002711FA23|nr:phage terminase small subunit P27 family [uncultured Parasutterella sp.]
MVGRPRKSDEVKKAQGTLQRCRINRKQFDVEGELPAAPPPSLSEEARAAWSMAVRCAPKGLLTALDHGVLERWCRSYALYRKYAKKVEAGDVEQCHPESGMRSLTPTVMMMIQAHKMMLQCEKELGFSPSARNKVKVEVKDDEEANAFLE